jgi:hypothetical protein
VYLYDEGEVRRVVDVIWSATSHPAKYQASCHTFLIETVNVVNLINAEQENVSSEYLINADMLTSTASTSVLVLKF